MLSYPLRCDGAAFVVVIDKVAHLARYTNPEDPLELSLRFIFERLQMYLDNCDKSGICIFDQNKSIDDTLHSSSMELLRNGSMFSSFSSRLASYTLSFNRILEFCLGNSKNSIGLQVADFFATMTNYYHKRVKPDSCDWWDVLLDSLHRRDGEVEGVGYKESPA
jgi:hypothetical protein